MVETLVGTLGTGPIRTQPDGLSSTRLVTDASGNQAGTQTYDAYGSSRSQSGIQLPFGFAGQQSDPESGLQYLRAREYDPTTGRFLSRDPLSASPGSAGSAYPYANDSPAQYTDPSGLWTLGFCYSIGGGIAIFGSVSVCYVVTSSGDVGQTVSGTFGGISGGFGGVSLGGQACTGTQLSDLTGPFGDVGASAGIGPGIGGDVNFGSDPNGGSAYCANGQGGAEGNLTLPALPAEGHAGVTVTKVHTFLNIPDVACKVVGLFCKRTPARLTPPRLPTPGPPNGPVWPTLPSPFC